MTVSPSPVVTPVVDYEPPLCGTPASSPPDAAPRVAARGRHLHAVPSPDPVSPQQRAAAAFADAALRSVLEVIDQRRPAAQLRPLLLGGLADTVVALSRATNPRRVAAVLRRVRVQAADPTNNAFEVAAMYSRGPRTHALACRVELVPTLRGERWQLVALHIG
ncbi:Rv3235 family protein [Mycolicibacterium mengxianglii]|uniref:Rv3235 family protein n=1 Tax=Mycolicibacterium mengxianglii TaxID=2736649 RepID=UPI0018D10003|nr:Rv3235 family protein [Mycolicibacterium mengxianglii]